MIERPIIFSAPMVRAILEGRKTQTRRVIKPQPNGSFAWTAYRECKDSAQFVCPYGQPGDRLWVRETWDFLPSEKNKAMILYWADGTFQEKCAPHGYNPMIYGRERMRPSIHMPQWASRITLVNAGVRVERLQEISEADAQAEGCTSDWHKPVSTPHEPGEWNGTSAIDDYANLWESINGPGSWKANPFVWVVKFKAAA